MKTLEEKKIIREFVKEQIDMMQKMRIPEIKEFMIIGSMLRQVDRNTFIR